MWRDYGAIMARLWRDYGAIMARLIDSRQFLDAKVARY
jgi:hypothetical protein